MGLNEGASVAVKNSELKRYLWEFVLSPMSRKVHRATPELLKVSCICGESREFQTIVEFQGSLEHPWSV